MAKLFAKDPFTLIAFHRLLIACGILACVGFGVWELTANRQRGTTGAIVGAVVSFALAVALGFYLRKIRGKSYLR